MKYRSDIDGLRALAVLPVVLFHAGFSTFSGGFVGVDVFFVISGYLITRILLTEIEEERFSIIHFYERRARRILPALFIVMLGAFIAAYFIYFPKDFTTFNKSLIATIFFVSNIFFWVDGSSYFASSSDVMPLLHTWSLAVEEQFYIFFPILLIFVARFIPKWLKPLLWLALISSFAISMYGVFHHPKATFYLIPTRAWELLIGSMAAAGYIALPKKQMIRETASIIGFLSIAITMLTLTKAHHFPAHNALYPTIGAVLIILAGQDGFRTLVGRLLSLKPIVFIGLISYSLYLWHWPLIAITSYTNVYPLGLIQEITLVVASIILATLSWRFVEQPFRGGDSYFTRKHVFSLSIIGSLLFIAIGIASIKMNGLPKRFSPELQRLIAYDQSRFIPAETCELFVHGRSHNAFDPSCWYGAENTEPTVALWGDSHSDYLTTSLGKMLAESGRSLEHYTFAACAPLVGIGVNHASDADCKKYKEDVLQRVIENEKIETIILMARWNFFVKGMAHDIGPAESKLPPDPLSEQEREEQFSAAFDKTLTTLTNANKRVILVYPVPEVGYEVPSTLARLAQRGKSPESFTTPYSQYVDRQKFVLDTFDQFNHPNLLKVRPTEILCDEQQCYTYKNGHALYYDSHHISLEGVELIAPLFKDHL